MTNSNLGHLHKGSKVRVKKSELKGREPSTWQNNAVLVRFEHDQILTELNKQGKTIFRCIVQFEGTPTEQDIRKYGGRRCREASLLPLMLESI